MEITRDAGHLRLFYAEPGSRPSPQGSSDGKENLHQSGVLGELHAGFEKGRRKRENEELLRRFLASSRVEIAPIVQQTALCYAHIVNHLRQIGRPIPTNDIWVAAGAMELSVPVITTDAHFRVVSQIRLEYYEPADAS